MEISSNCVRREGLLRDEEPRSYIPTAIVHSLC